MFPNKGTWPWNKPYVGESEIRYGWLLCQLNSGELCCEHWKWECLSRFQVLAVHTSEDLHLHKKICFIFHMSWEYLFYIPQAIRIYFLYSTYRENVCFIFHISWEYLFYILQVIRMFVLYSTSHKNICFIFRISWECLFCIPNIVRIFVLYSTSDKNMCFIFHKPWEYLFYIQ